MTDEAGDVREVDSGRLVEGLGQRLNLMLTRATFIAPSPEAALVRLAEILGAQSVGRRDLVGVLTEIIGGVVATADPMRICTRNFEEANDVRFDGAAYVAAGDIR